MSEIIVEKDGDYEIVNIFSLSNLNKNLVCEFFAIFSRFEFAMKECGKYKAPKSQDPKKDRVEPNWDELINKLAPKLCLKTSGKLESAVRDLVGSPPKVQTYDLSFKNTKPSRPNDNYAEAISLTRRVRNNLFHGGKHSELSEAQKERDERLLRASIVVLTHCLINCQELRIDFETSKW
ncbi:hypothetical protein ACE38U_18135 [Cedecea sp. S5-13]|uniref:hypothetical protein n=1 Tax=Cedecea selenatireducens TaxID=3144416 RepID=UPI0035CD04A3